MSLVDVSLPSDERAILDQLLVLKADLDRLNELNTVLVRIIEDLVLLARIEAGPRP